MDDFVALDFERVNRHYASICSIGVVRSRDGVLGDPAHFWIRPPAGYDVLEPRNASLTGIRESDYADAPDARTQVANIVRCIGQSVVVGHGVASADLPMLAQAHEVVGLGPLRALAYLDTVAVARVVLGPNRNSYKLPAVYRASVGEAMPGRHHNAADDAWACARIVQAWAQEGRDLSQHVRWRSSGLIRPVAPPPIC